MAIGERLQCQWFFGVWCHMHLAPSADVPDEWGQTSRQDKVVS
ncbi:hypothetical protein EJK54_0875 [Moraxella catarrhalis]|uniref:Uncharacterized protein n=1 Tax=Moraxella catarrhalis TaxID=480 RepID=A0ABY0BJH3_MORCA|nr:hypothetical protein EJK54_0875 [Moraxella catarrhalis]